MQSPVSTGSVNRTCVLCNVNFTGHTNCNYLQTCITFGYVRKIATPRLILFICLKTMNDIEPIVIDNGSWMCKAGFAGDKTARAYERTVIGDGTVCSGKVHSLV